GGGGGVADQATIVNRAALLADTVAAEAGGALRVVAALLAAAAWTALQIVRTARETALAVDAVPGLTGVRGNALRGAVAHAARPAICDGIADLVGAAVHVHGFVRTLPAAAAVQRAVDHVVALRLIAAGAAGGAVGARAALFARGCAQRAALAASV